MFKTILSLALALVLANTIYARQSPVPTAGGKEWSRVEKLKENIARRGVGEKARVMVKRQDGTKLKGYISRAGDDEFVLTDSKTGQTTTLAYRDISEVKGRGLSRKTKIGIGIAIGTGATAIGLALALRCVPFGCRQ